MRVLLERFCAAPHTTIGILTIPDEGFWCYTVENPWKDNEPYVSCIPAGWYPFRFGHYNRGDYNAYEICDVPGRSSVKIHLGNVAQDVQGCVVLGMELGVAKGDWAILGSNSLRGAPGAFPLFMRAMRERDGLIQVYWKLNPETT